MRGWRAAALRAPVPAIEFPEESPEPRFDGKWGRGQPCGRAGKPPLSPGWRGGKQGTTAAFLFPSFPSALR